MNFQNPEYFDDINASPEHVPKRTFSNNNRTKDGRSASQRGKDYYNDLTKNNLTELKPLMIADQNSETTV